MSLSFTDSHIRLEMDIDVDVDVDYDALMWIVIQMRSGMIGHPCSMNVQSRTRLIVNRDMGNKSAATMGMDEAPRKLFETLRELLSQRQSKPVPI